MNHTRMGILVAIEGIDGAGKTTQVRNLESLLRRDGIPFVSTKEPTDGPWGQKIRQSAKTGRLSAEEEMRAFVEDRREHVGLVVNPALVAGKVVLIDRYFFSTVAYQGARGLSPAMLLAENAFAPQPNILIVLDIDPAVGLRRIQQRGDAADLFEKEEELGRARKIFQWLKEPYLHLLDATRDPDDLTREIYGLLQIELSRAGIAASAQLE